MTFEERWKQKQDAAKPGRYYGDGGTIHSGTELDVEVDSSGRVVAVWFRCQPLPFRQADVDVDRANEMRSMYRGYGSKLTGVEILDQETPA